MTVKELKKTLEKVDDNKIVILSSDEGGNNYSPLAEFNDEMVYKPHSTYSGEVGYKKLTVKLKKEGYSDTDIISDGVDCLILWPSN